MANSLCTGKYPNVYFKSGSSRVTNASGRGDKVAIIAPFPKVSSSLEFYTSLRQARDGIGWTSGVQDTYPTEEKDKTSKLASERDSGTGYFTGCACLKYLFKEGLHEDTISEVIVCNYSRQITTTSDGTTTAKCSPTTGNPLLNTEIIDETKDKDGNQIDYLANALEQLRGEDFDILLLGFAPTPKQLRTIVDWEQSMYTFANPVGLIYGTSEKPLAVYNQGSTSEKSLVQQEVSGTTINSMTDLFAEYNEATDKGIYVPDNTDDTTTTTTTGTTEKLSVIETEMGIFKDESEKKGNHHTLYACLPQSVHLDYEAADKYLSPVEWAAYYAGCVGVQDVNKSMTNKTIPHVDAINEKIVYTHSGKLGSDVEKMSQGYKLLSLGVTLIDSINRSSNEYFVINSEQPCGFDIAHLRTGAYIIKSMNLRPYLGRVNNLTSVDSINTQLGLIKTSLKNSLDIVDDIAYSVIRKTKNCIYIYLDIDYYGIILNEVVYVTEQVIEEVDE